MQVVVTGGAGFIGSSLVRALLTNGHQVLVLDDLSTGKAENLDPRASFRRIDILDDSLAELISEVRPEAVVHLAAQSSVPASWADPERDRQVNAEGTRRVAAAARDAGARIMLSASSAAVYGEPECVPLPETARKSPENPYGDSKLEAESLLAAELEGTGVDFASLRFANVYGPRQDAAGEGGVVAVFCGRIHAGEAPTIHGTGSQTRDFIYVGDIVAAILAALQSQSPLAGAGVDGPAYNISTAHETPVSQLLMTIRTAAGYFGPQVTAPAREGDVDRSALDPSKAERVFGWKAQVSLESGIALTWRWFSGRQ